MHSQRHEGAGLTHQSWQSKHNPSWQSKHNPSSRIASMSRSRILN